MKNNNLAVYSAPEEIPGYDTLSYLQREILRAQWEEQVATAAPVSGDDDEVSI